jgi:hypothetical protein
MLARFDPVSLNFETIARCLTSGSPKALFDGSKSLLAIQQYRQEQTYEYVHDTITRFNKKWGTALSICTQRLRTDRHGFISPNPVKVGEILYFVKTMGDFVYSINLKDLTMEVQEFSS